MLKIILYGCNGRMGRVVSEFVMGDADCKIVAGIDIVTEQHFDYPVFERPDEFVGEADVMVDFSSSSVLENKLEFCLRHKLPLVLCTTGHSETQTEQIKLAANRIPIFKSGNMSLGINLMLELIKRTTFALGEGFDVEIVEKHHSKKEDAPSGTAIMLADAVKSGKDYTPDYLYDRTPFRRPRAKTEIGISSVRAGTIPGEHSVIFAGADEVLEIKHSVYSREIFANGAVRAAKFIIGCSEPGIYDMGDMMQ